MPCWCLSCYLLVVGPILGYLSDYQHIHSIYERKNIMSDLSSCLGTMLSEIVWYLVSRFLLYVSISLLPIIISAMLFQWSACSKEFVKGFIMTKWIKIVMKWMLSPKLIIISLVFRIQIFSIQHFGLVKQPPLAQLHWNKHLYLIAAPYIT